MKNGNENFRLPDNATRTMKTEAITEIRSTHKDDLEVEVHTVMRDSGQHNHPVKRQEHAMPLADVETLGVCTESRRWSGTHL